MCANQGCHPKLGIMHSSLFQFSGDELFTPYRSATRATRCWSWARVPITVRQRAFMVGMEGMLDMISVG